MAAAVPECTLPAITEADQKMIKEMILFRKEHDISASLDRSYQEAQRKGSSYNRSHEPNFPHKKQKNEISRLLGAFSTSRPPSLAATSSGHTSNLVPLGHSDRPPGVDKTSCWTCSTRDWRTTVKYLAQSLVPRS
jgi:hypothetical protein